MGQWLSEQSARDGCLVFRSSLSPGSGFIKETPIEAKHKNTNRQRINQASDESNNRPKKGSSESIHANYDPRLEVITKEVSHSRGVAKKGFPGFVRTGRELSYTSPLGILYFYSFHESLFKGILLLWVRNSENAFSVYAHYSRERPLRGGMGE